MTSPLVESTAPSVSTMKSLLVKMSRAAPGLSTKMIFQVRSETRSASNSVFTGIHFNLFMLVMISMQYLPEYHRSRKIYCCGFKKGMNYNFSPSCREILRTIFFYLTDNPLRGRVERKTQSAPSYLHSKTSLPIYIQIRIINPSSAKNYLPASKSITKAMS